MDTRHTYPSNTKVPTPSYGGALRLTGGNLDFPHSTRLFYQPSLACRMILVPILLGSSNETTSGKFAPPYLICVDMPKILESFQSTYMV